MASILGFNDNASFRKTPTTLPDKPVSMPYDFRDQITWIDFSNPVNPLGAPPSIVQEIQTALVDGEISYTPDRAGHEFRTRVGGHLGISADSIIVGTSPTQMISYAAMAFDYCTVGIATPCPPEYMTAIVNAGHNFIELENPFSFAPVDAYTARQSIGSFDGVVLANPAYPASRLIPRATLVGYLETCRWVIVDESYIELAFAAESLMPLLERYDNLIIVRTPSVTFGMPGIPMSYVVAHPETIERISQVYDGSDVNMFAEVLSYQMIMQGDYIDQTHEFLDQEIPWMQCMLGRIPGITIHTAEGNFVLCEYNPAEGMRLGAKNVEELIMRLQLAGFMIDPLNDIPGLESEGFFCVSVKTRSENERLLEALHGIISVRDMTA